MANIPQSKSQKIIHNNTQRILGIIGARPLLCHSWQRDNLLCPGCPPGNVFKCSRCQLLLPWCCGSSDVFPDWCDICVNDYIKLEGWPE
jgi:hypothetical protein